MALRFCPVQLPTPYRFEHRQPLKVHAVYATEIDCPQGVSPVSWMLLTTEVVADIPSAVTILRWIARSRCIFRNMTKFSTLAAKLSDIDWRQKE
jgi:hypothetical protein